MMTRTYNRNKYMEEEDWKEVAFNAVCSAIVSAIVSTVVAFICSAN